MKREKNGTEGLGDQVIAENLPNLGKDTNIKIQESQRTPLQIQQNIPSPRRVIVKFTKYTDKERIMKVAREKKSLTYKGMKTDQVHSRPIHRNLAGKKREARYIPCAKSEKYAAKNSLSSKSVVQNRRDRGTWVAQSVGHLTLAQVMISWFLSSSPKSGSVLTAQSLEPASDFVSLTLSAPPPLILCPYL